MSKIYCILGKSSVGKDSLLNILEVNGFKRVISHTSRPMRSTELNGREYHFIDVNNMMDMIQNDEFIERRTYKVVGDTVWYYGIHKKEIDINGNDDYIVIVDGQGFQAIKSYYGDENVIGIYMYIDNRERLLRALNRCKLTDKDVDEIVRRYQADDIDFTKDIIDECTLKINNINLNQSADIVIRNIKGKCRKV